MPNVFYHKKLNAEALNSKNDSGKEPDNTENNDESIQEGDWMRICNMVQSALYKSCNAYVNDNGILTTEGERAFGCIRNGALLGGGAALLGAPLEFIIPGLNVLAGMTGCDGIVKLDLLSSLENPTHLLNTLTQMLSENGFTNTMPQNDFDQNALPRNDFSINTNSQDEFLLFSNELFSLNYPSDWKYKENNFFDESNVVFYYYYHFLHALKSSATVRFFLLCNPFSYKNKKIGQQIKK